MFLKRQRKASSKISFAFVKFISQFLQTNKYIQTPICETILHEDPLKSMIATNNNLRDNECSQMFSGALFIQFISQVLFSN